MTQLSNKLRVFAKYAVAISAVVLLAGSYLVADLQSVTGNAPIASFGEFIADYSLLTEIRLKKSHDRLLNANLVRSRRTKEKKPLPPKVPKKIITGDPATAAGHEKLNIVWLLSYPFAGSNVALSVFEEYTGYSMGTNYGDIVVTEEGLLEDSVASEPINPKQQPNGPYRYDMTKPLPPFGNVLVKTHCGGHCFDMDEVCMPKPVALSIWGLREYLTQCASGTSYTVGGRKSLVTYNFYLPQKTMLLVRHPLELVLARYVNYMEGHVPNDYSWNHEGIEQFCKDYDNKSGTVRLMMGYDSAEALAMAESGEVPCHAELYKITRFYNNAFKATAFLQEPVHIVHFEDYTADLGGTIQGMMDFMEYRIMENARQMPFKRTGDDDHPWFSDAEKSAMLKFVNLIASKQTSEAFASYT